MTSTLSLWRNLGNVMGVAISSLIVQNALRVYLEQYITGEKKYKVCFLPSLLYSIHILFLLVIADHQGNSQICCLDTDTRSLASK
jgi:hypothetical protein